MLIFNDRQREIIHRIDCSRCSDRRACDQIRHECPKVNLQTLMVDDISILQPETGTVTNEAQKHETGFMQTTKKDFETNLYGNTTRCRYKNKILSFFSGEREARGLLFFFFSHQGYYYRALRDKSLTDAMLEKQIMNFLYPDNKSFMYAGWRCEFNTADLLYYLYTPGEMEQSADMRISEMKVSSSAQAIDVINSY